MDKGCPVLMSKHRFLEGAPCGDEPDARDEKGRCGLHGEFDKAPRECLEWFMDRIEAFSDTETHVDFTRCIFPHNFTIPSGFKFPKPPNFRKATFGDYAGFDGAIFGKGTVFDGATFGDGTGFDCATFGDRAEFRGATFGDSTWFGDATFGDRAGFDGATFGDGTWFDGATFGDRAEFRGATFGDNTWFDGATFGDRAGFYGATFSNQVGFEETTFGDQAGFGGATFGEGTMFDGATFGDGTWFDGATFGDGAGFRGTTFGGDVSLSQATFNGATNFSSLRIQGTLHFRNVTLNGISDWNKTRLAPKARFIWKDSEIVSDLRLDNLRFPTPVGALKEDLKRWEQAKTRAEEDEKEPPRKPKPTDPCYQPQSPDIRIDFRNVPIRATTNIRFQGTDTDDPQDRIDCSKILFAHTDVSRIRFRNAKWDNEPAWRSRLGQKLHLHRRLTRVADEDYLWKFPGGQEPKVEADDRLAPSLVADIYKGLRVTYEDHLRQADAGRFHVREMEMRRLSLSGKFGPALDVPGGSLWNGVHGALRWSRRIGLSLYRTTSLYGESFALPVVWLMAWILLFGWLMGADLPDLPPMLGSLHDTFSRGLGLAPRSVAGHNVVEFVGRVGGVYLVSVAVVALRRHFRRHRGGL